MIGKIITTCILGLAITLNWSLGVFAQSKHSLQKLTDGDYFYGQSRSVNQDGVRYVIFRKIGLTVIGRDYRYRSTDDWECFRGRINGNSIVDVTAGSQIFFKRTGTTRWEFGASEPKDLNKFYRLQFNQIPANAKSGFLSCIEVFKNRK